MSEEMTTLETFYQGWHNYQNLLVTALAPLTQEQLNLRTTSNLRSVSEIVLHIIGARARWFYQLLEVGDQEFGLMGRWDRKGEPQRDASELVHGLETTWQVMQAAITSWTPEDMQYSYPGEDEGDPERISRQWVIWHLIEHDLHHGGEVSFTLGMHGLQAPDL